MQLNTKSQSYTLEPVSDQVSHPHKTKAKIIVKSIYFMIGDGEKGTLVTYEPCKIKTFSYKHAK